LHCLVRAMAATASEFLLPSARPAKLGKPITFGPPAGEPAKAAILWLHGFGDQPDGWAQLLRPLRNAASPSWKWLHLRAPRLAQPCYKNTALPAWGQFFSTQCLHAGAKDHEDPDESGKYAASVLAVHAEIARLEREHNLTSQQVVVAGFSQGAAVALESVLTHPQRLAGCVALSGWLTRRARAALAKRPPSGTPFLLCHGTKDDMVGYDCAEAALKAFHQSMGDNCASVQLEQFKGMAHSSCAKELRLVAAFLQKHLMSSESGAPELKIPAWEPGGTAADSDCDCSDGEEEESGETPDLIFVRKRALDQVREQLTSASEVSKASVQELVQLDEVADDEVLVPVDAAVLGEDALEDVDVALEKLGAQAVAEAFVKAAQEAASTGAVELTAARWRQLVDAGFSDFGEEGEEEEECEGDEEEEADGGSDACENPEGDGEPTEAKSKRPRLS